MPKATMKSTDFDGRPAQHVFCPRCGATNSHLSGPPREVESQEMFKQGAVQVPVKCEPEEHPFFVYVGDHKGDIVVVVDEEDYDAG